MRKVNIVVGMANMVASGQSNANLVTYSLGACVAVAVYDPETKAGGLLHSGLPSSSMSPESQDIQRYMFVDTGLPLLFRAVYALGGLKERLIVKMAGGAEVLNEQGTRDTGPRNLQAVKSVLARNNVSLAAGDMEGQDVLGVRLDLETGALTLDVTSKGSFLI